LTINGDIPDRQTGLKLARQYGVDGVMIGRGIFNNPFAFERQTKDHSSQELLDLLRLHLDLCDKYSKLELRPFTALHRFFKIYVRGFRGASELRNQLMSTKSTDEVRALLDNFGSKNLDGMGEQ
jgi:tRNA-dihydrouridine synthase